MTTSSPGSHSASSDAAIASVAPVVTSTSVSGSYVEPVPVLLVRGDRGAQLGDARAGRVLVVTGADGVDGGVEHLLRPVGVGEALAEVDRPRRDRQRRHLGEDRGAEALQA